MSTLYFESTLFKLEILGKGREEKFERRITIPQDGFLLVLPKIKKIQSLGVFISQIAIGCLCVTFTEPSPRVTLKCFVIFGVDQSKKTCVKKKEEKTQM